MVTVGQCQYIYNLHRGCCNTRNEFSSIYYPIETIIYLVNNINNDYGEQKRVLLIYYNLYIIILYYTYPIDQRQTARGS